MLLMRKTMSSMRYPRRAEMMRGFLPYLSVRGPAIMTNNIPGRHFRKDGQLAACNSNPFTWSIPLYAWIWLTYCWVSTCTSS